MKYQQAKLYPDCDSQILLELKRKCHRCSVWAKQRERKRRFKPALPSFIMGNVRSLTYKTDEFEALTRTNLEFWQCGSMYFTKTCTVNPDFDSTQRD